MSAVASASNQHHVWRLLAVVGLLAGVVTAVTDEPADAVPPPQVHWSTCYRQLSAQTGVDYECAQANVPLDHDRPNGTAIQLALVRVPATNPAERIGSLFLNPGGPGGSGVDLVVFVAPAFEAVFGPEVRERFDIVGFDPRGVHRSTGLRCFGNPDQAFSALAPFPFPVTEEEEDLWIAADMEIADACDQRGGRIGEHMSTANVARDLDLLRAAVGDDQLTYHGVSYGSMIGQTYANLFPDRVRAVVIDSVLDPVAWSNVEGEIPFSTRLRSDEGAQETLQRFFELCDTAGADACALAPDAEARFDAVAESLRAEPLVVEDPETGEQFRIRYADLVGFALDMLYDPFAYPLLAGEVAFLESLLAAPSPSMSATEHELAGWVNKRGFPHYPNEVEGFPGVACSDTNSPGTEVYREQADLAEAAFGYFGRPWTWISSICAQWPFTDEDRYQGPWTAETSNPVLVMSNLYDPATRYEGAVTADDLLPNSALVTVDHPGHLAFLGSRCASAAQARYLLDPTAAADTFCPQEFNPFLLGPPPAAETQDGATRTLRARLLSGPWGR